MLALIRILTLLHYSLPFLLCWGLNNYGNREIASKQSNIEERSKTFFEIYLMQIFCFFICAAFYSIYIFTFAEDLKAASIQGLFILSSLFNINWFFFGMEKFKITVIRNTVIKFLTVICVFIFVKNKDDIYMYIFIMSMGSLISEISIWPFLKRYIRFYKISLNDVIRHFKPNLVLFIPVISVSVYRIIDKVILGYLGTMEEVGYFENAEKIVNVPIALITAIGTVMMPRTTSLIATGNINESRKYIDKTMLFVLFFSIGAMAGILSISNEFSILFFGENFSETGVIMNFLAVSVLFIAFGNVIRTQFLIPNKKDKIFVVSAILGALVNIIMNIILIPNYGAIGAGISLVITEFFVAYYQIYNVRENISYLKYCKYASFFLLVGSLMFFCLKLLPTLTNDYFNLILKIIIGAIIYGSVGGLYILPKLNKNLADITKVLLRRRD